MIKHLTIFEIKGHKNYILPGKFSPVEAARIIRKHTIKTVSDIQAYCSEYAKAHKSYLVVKTYTAEMV